jgi:F-type H+-transporting ATPase subunit h
MYLREIKAYKPTPVKPSDSEGHVQKFSVPKSPKSPEETDIANELKAYEASTVELEGSAGTEGGESAPIDQDWFEDEPEEDEHAKGH